MFAYISWNLLQTNTDWKVKQGIFETYNHIKSAQVILHYKCYFMAKLDNWSFFVWVYVDFLDQLDEWFTEFFFHADRPEHLTFKF